MLFARTEWRFPKFFKINSLKALSSPKTLYLPPAKDMKTSQMRKLLSFALAAFLLFVSIAPTFAAPAADGETKAPATVIELILHGGPLIICLV